MALRWDWKDEVGTSYLRQDGQVWEFTLYQGNALLIELFKYEKDGEEYWQMHNFYADKDHLKNCVKDDCRLDGKEYILYRDKFTDQDLKLLVPALSKMGADVVVRVRV